MSHNDTNILFQPVVNNFIWDSVEKKVIRYFKEVVSFSFLQIHQSKLKAMLPKCEQDIISCSALTRSVPGYVSSVAVHFPNRPEILGPVPSTT